MSSIMIDRTAGLSSATAYKGPCRVASAVNVSMSGLQIVDGVQTEADDRVLLTNQTSDVDNGIYIVDIGPWKRSPDFNKTRDIVKGTRVWVVEGDSGPAEMEVSSENPVRVGIDPIYFNLSAGSVNAAALAEAVREAEAARDIAAGYASDAISGGMDPGLSTVVGMGAITIPAGINHFNVAGYYAAGDGGGALYVKVDDEPTHAGKFQTADGAWWELLTRHPDVRMFGAIEGGLEVSGSAFVSAAIYGALRECPVYFSGKYLIDETLPIYSKTGFVGDGSDTSRLILADGAECNVIETDGFSTYTGTSNIDAPRDFILKGFSIDGNRDNNFAGVAPTVDDGYGVRIYGYDYIVEDVKIKYCAGPGFYSEYGPSGQQPTRTNYIKGLHIHYCSYEGFYFIGPADIPIDDVVVGLIYHPGRTGAEASALTSLISPSHEIDGFVIERLSHASGTCELGFVHSYHSRDGRCIRMSGTSGALRVTGQTVHAEGGRGNLLVEGDSAVDLTKVLTRNNEFGLSTSGRADVELNVSNSRCTIGSLTVNRASNGKSGPAIHFNDSDNCYIDNAFLDGADNPGHAVVFTGSCVRSGIGNLRARRWKGSAWDGKPSSCMRIEGGVHILQFGNILADNNDIFWHHSATTTSFIQIGGAVNAFAASGAALLDWATTPTIAYLRGANMILDANGNRSFSSFRGAGGVDTSTTGLKTVTLNHNMYRTPAIAECSIGSLWGGATPPELSFIGVASITATQITLAAYVKVPAAGTLTLSVSIS